MRKKGEIVKAFRGCSPGEAIYELDDLLDDEPPPEIRRRKRPSSRPVTYTGNGNALDESLKGLPDSLKIGDNVICKLDMALLKGFKDHRHTARPMIVYGIYRRDGKVVAADFLYRSTQPPKKCYPSDYYMNPARDGANDLCTIRTGSVYTLANSQKYFRQANGPGVPDKLWPDLLVRRAEACKFSSVLNYCQSPGVLEHIAGAEREGFTLPISCGRTCSQQWAPDLLGGDFTRKNTDILSEDAIRRIVSFSFEYTRQQKKSRNYPFVFPPVDEWPEEFRPGTTAPPAGRLVPQL